jgi:hypothetical protein
MTNGSDYLLLVYVIIPGNQKYIDFTNNKFKTEQYATSESRVFTLAETSCTTDVSSRREITRSLHAIRV